MDPNAHANMVLTLVGLGALAIGTLAMVLRFINRSLMNRQTTGREVFHQFVSDVKRGEGFTFHQGKDALAKSNAPVVSDTERPLRPAEWIHLVNEEPDKVPHVVIVGGSGTGKTTLATGLLQTRPGRIIIITPKTDDTWGGLPFITIDDDGSFATAAAAFKGLLAEVKTRLVASKHGANRAEWLNVVLDDYPALRGVCPEAQEVLLLIARLGRSLRVRLLMLSYSGQVKELGLEGLGETRNHFVWIRLDRQQRARLEWDEQIYQLDTAAVVEHAARPIPAHRWWSPLPISPAMPARVRSSLSNLSRDDLDVPVRGGEDNVVGETGHTGTGGTDGTPHQEAVPGEIEIEERTEGVPAKLTPEAIRTLYSVWGSKNKIAAMLTGTKAKRMAIIDAALAEKEEVIDI